MEDAHTAELDIDGKGSAFFGVFDGDFPHVQIGWDMAYGLKNVTGHAGTDVAIYSSKYLYTNLTATAFYKGGQYEKVSACLLSILPSYCSLCETSAGRAFMRHF